MSGSRGAYSVARDSPSTKAFNTPTPYAAPAPPPDSTIACLGARIAVMHRLRSQSTRGWRGCGASWRLACGSAALDEEILLGLLNDQGVAENQQPAHALHGM